MNFRIVLFLSILSETESPESLTKLDDVIVAQERTKVKIMVKFAGKPKPEVKWLRKGREIFSFGNNWQ